MKQYQGSELALVRLPSVGVVIKIHFLFDFRSWFVPKNVNWDTLKQNALLKYCR